MPMLLTSKNCYFPWNYRYWWYFLIFFLTHYLCWQWFPLQLSIVPVFDNVSPSSDTPHLLCCQYWGYRLCGKSYQREISTRSSYRSGCITWRVSHTIVLVYDFIKALFWMNSCKLIIIYENLLLDRHLICET